MAESKGEGKIKRKKKVPSKKYKHYDVSSGSVKYKNKICPKCGAGVFMASHSDRETCGKCNYTVMKHKK